MRASFGHLRPGILSAIFRARTGFFPSRPLHSNLGFGCGSPSSRVFSDACGRIPRTLITAFPDGGERIFLLAELLTAYVSCFGSSGPSAPPARPSVRPGAFLASLLVLVRLLHARTCAREQRNAAIGMAMDDGVVRNGAKLQLGAWQVRDPHENTEGEGQRIDKGGKISMGEGCGDGQDERTVGMEGRRIARIGRSRCIRGDRGACEWRCRRERMETART